jgi:homospermidine synthase
LVLLDEQDGREKVPLPARQRVLPPHRIDSAGDLRAVLAEERIDQMLDVSSIDTLEAIEVCESLGASYLGAGANTWQGNESDIPRSVRAIQAAARERDYRQSFLVGAGMNPGVVNALVFAGLEAFGRAVGRPATAAGLDLHAILVTELDTTEEIAGEAGRDGPGDGVFRCTWSPEHCLDELTCPAIVARGGRVVELDHMAASASYRVRCAGAVTEAFLVPHEEVVSLAPRFPSVELAFLYAPAPAARAVLADCELLGLVENVPVRRLYSPHVRSLRGRDSVGVLLCSKRHGELWIGFDTRVEAGAPYDTNATQLQVAAGVIAGWLQLGTRSGIHFVEDLDWRSYLEVVESVLGLPRIHWDPGAPPRSVADRRLPS